MSYLLYWFRYLNRVLRYGTATETDGPSIQSKTGTLQKTPYTPLP